MRDRAVAAIIQNQRGEILIAKRPEGKSYPGYWEFPGGKIEAEETVLAALKREIREELAIDVISAEQMLETESILVDRTVQLFIWRVYEFVGNPVGNEGQAVRWVKPELLSLYKFPPANAVIIEKLLAPVV